MSPLTGLEPAAFGLIKGLDRNKVETVNKHSIFQISCRAAITLFVLAWSSLAFCGEIHDAAKSGDLEKVKALLKANPDLVFSKDTIASSFLNGGTPLHFASWNGHKDVAELLLANKADVNATNNLGWTPLHVAVRYDHKDVVELLLASNADVNAKDYGNTTPLHFAVMFAHKDVMELLLASNADVNAKNNDGYTPLHRAVESGQTNVDVLDLLLAYKSDVDTRDNFGGTPLTSAAGTGHANVAKLLLANKANVNNRDIFGKTPLHVAAWRGYKDVVEVLVASNADVNATTTDGYNGTPLTAALGMDHEDVAEVLIQHGSRGSKCTTKPFVDWYSYGDIRFHFVKSVTDDYQEYITKNKLVMPNGFDVYYENQTGKYAVTFEAFLPNQNASQRYALIYDKNNRRIKVVKYDYHRYQS